jgi:hypothetical protein
MVVKKRLKKFSISNKLAYTLMVILSLALLGIGVYAYGGNNPPVMGHTAGEINLDWGPVIGCEGASNACSFYDTDPMECLDQNGCSNVCMGSYTLLCSSLDSYTCNSRSGGACSYDGYTCTGSWSEAVNCGDFHISDCASTSERSAYCYTGCSGISESCGYFNNDQNECTNQGGCLWNSIPRAITPNTRGINIPNLNVNYICDLNQANCVAVRGSSSVTPIQYDGSDLNSNTRLVRVHSFIQCPPGSYLNKVEINHEWDGTGDQAVLDGQCTTLPIG